MPADLRLVQTENLRVNEAALTGESVPANKRLDPVEEDALLAERASMLYKGTTVVEGNAEAVTVATGMATELGRIAELSEEAGKQDTPLERRLNKLGGRLALVTLGVVAVVGVAGLVAGQPARLMIETAIALGVAAVPEGIPIVATLALARGMWRMARRQALINRLTAVETLGTTRVVMVDKTGTLTENRMHVERVTTVSGDFVLEDGDGEGQGALRPHGDGEKGEGGREDAEGWLPRRAVEVGVLCNNATLEADKDDSEEAAGDPLEVALLQAGTLLGMRRKELLERKPEVREETFDPEVMMMATFHQVEGGYEVNVKGAPGAVLEVCRSCLVGRDEERELSDEQRREWNGRAEKLGREGLRLLAVADKVVDDPDSEPYDGLRFLGMVGLMDPPREGVREAIERCQQAGIRVVMVTGDQAETAQAIGEQVGILSDDQKDVRKGQELEGMDEMGEDERAELRSTVIFARVSPEEKLSLVRLFQEDGEIVAMTGDGVNDAPALKRANIGIAMGRRGTDAARKVSDMVLRDDSFTSIVAAVKYGRIIFGNIRKSLVFMLCTNVAEVLAVAVASLAQVPLPLRPLQILYLNVITDVFPALALGVGEGNPRVMEREPRSKEEPILTRHHWLGIGAWSTVISACVLGGLATGLVWLGLPELQAVTISFLTLAFSKLWFVFNLRDMDSSLTDNDIVRNRWIWGAIGLCIALLVLAVYLPGLSGVLQTRRLDPVGWGVVLGLSLVPVLIGQLLRGFGRGIRWS